MNKTGKADVSKTQDTPKSTHQTTYYVQLAIGGAIADAAVAA